MPNKLYVIAGFVEDYNKNRVGNITLQFRNTNSGESVTAISSSDPASLGEFSKNMADLTSDWTVNDIVEVSLQTSINNSVNNDWQGTSFEVTLTAGGSSIDNYIYVGKQLNAAFSAESKTNMQEIAAKYYRNFLRGVKSGNAETLTTSLAEATDTEQEQYLRLFPGQTAYITGVYVGTNGEADTIGVQLRKKAASNGLGIAKDIGMEITSGSGNGMTYFPVKLRVDYAAGVSQSIVMAIRGSGTTDDAVCFMEGYVIG